MRSWLANGVSITVGDILPFSNWRRFEEVVCRGEKWEVLQMLERAKILSWEIFGALTLGFEKNIRSKTDNLCDPSFERKIFSNGHIGSQDLHVLQ